MFSTSRQKFFSAIKPCISSEISCVTARSFSQYNSILVTKQALLASTITNVRNPYFIKSRENNNIFESRICKAHYGKFSQFSIVTPGKLSAKKTVPDCIVTPDYYRTGRVTPLNISNPEIKTEEQIEKLRASCKLARVVLNEAVRYAKAGITTDELDSFCHDLIISQGAYPSPLNYKGFPKSICTSVNNCACHGIPDDRKLLDGDIVNIDVTVYLNGYHGDCSETVIIGSVDSQGQKLVNVARDCMNEGINVCGPNVPFYIIGMAIQNKAEESNCSIVPAFAGHGIGEYFHGPPDIYHFDYECPGVMKPGMTFTIEPVVSEGGSEISILSDGWTALTRDDSRTAQFEHTVLITPTGVERLTT